VAQFSEKCVLHEIGVLIFLAAFIWNFSGPKTVILVVCYWLSTVIQFDIQELNRRKSGNGTHLFFVMFNQLAVVI